MMDALMKDPKLVVDNAMSAEIQSTNMVLQRLHEMRFSPDSWGNVLYVVKILNLIASGWTQLVLIMIIPVAISVAYSVDHVTSLLASSGIALAILGQLYNTLSNHKTYGDMLEHTTFAHKQWRILYKEMLIQHGLTEEQAEPVVCAAADTLTKGWGNERKN